MVFVNAYLLPIIVAVWFPLTFVITDHILKIIIEYEGTTNIYVTFCLFVLGDLVIYVRILADNGDNYCNFPYSIAVVRKDTVAVFPYISDTGTWAPTSCIFGIMLTIGGCFLLLTTYVRYRQIRLIDENNNFKPNVKKLNNAAICLAALSTLGMLIVANFQETNALIVHILGATTCFGGSAFYGVLQVMISFMVFPTFGQRNINILRVFIIVVCIISFFLVSIFAGIALLLFKGEDVTKWTQDDGGYEYHLVSTISEWIMAIFIMLFLLTYTKEFKLVQFKEPEIIVVETK